MTDQLIATRPRASECDDWAADWIVARRGPWFALIWMPVLLLAPIVTAVTGGNVPATVVYLLFAAWYVVTVVMPYRRVPEWWSEVCVAVLVVIAAAQFVISHGGEGFLYPLLTIAAATSIRRRFALGFVMALSISGSFAAGVSEGSLGSALLFGFASVMAGTSTYVIGALVDTVTALRTTRRRLAGLAVAEERQRFSRDLHDLLGHTLSVIVVKAEAIRRFAASDPAVATQHAQGIEDVGRTALADVRQAVAGYRELRLDDELTGAAEALDDAGISVDITHPLPELRSGESALFAWVVREAATNVLRHSSASHCTIEVTATADAAQIAIADNGHGAVAPEWGAGIRGMRERAQRQGGTLTIESDARGFALTVHIAREGSGA